MKILNEIEIKQVSGGFGGFGAWGRFNNFKYSSSELDKAAGRFADAYSDYSERSKTSGYGGGSVIGGSIFSAVGDAVAGRAGAAALGIFGAHVGKMYDDAFPLKEYFDVKSEAEKIYGLQ